MSIYDSALASIEGLEKWCANESYKGYDPFDGLNSTLFKTLPGNTNRLARLFWIQLFKHNPVNLRPLTGITKEYNAKGLGLFLSGYCNLHRHSPSEYYLSRINFFVDTLFSLQNTAYAGACWGYNFDWQARAFFQPKGTPTVVATSFISAALLDAYHILNDERLLKVARSACNFVLKDLNRTEDADGTFGLSYSPLDTTAVYNASLLGARLLARVSSLTHEPELMAAAKNIVAWACKRQQPDGAWSYSPLSCHTWIDNFHTGFNLESIADYQRFSGDISFTKELNAGLAYYCKTFFTAKGEPKYFATKLYPIDVHATAQLISTLAHCALIDSHKELVDNVLAWTIRNMQDTRGFFFYQKRHVITNKIPYMRWSQAWMFFGLSVYISSQQTP